MEGATGHSAGRMVAKIRSQQTTKKDPKIRVKAPRVDLKSDLDVVGTSQGTRLKSYVTMMLLCPKATYITLECGGSHNRVWFLFSILLLVSDFKFRTPLRVTHLTGRWEKNGTTASLIHSSRLSGFCLLVE